MTKLTKPVATTEAADPLLSMIERVILDPELPADRIEAVLNLRERQLNKDAEIQFNQAFAAMMSEMPTIPRTGKSNRNTYSTIDDIVETTKPVLSMFGFSLNWEVETNIKDRIVMVKAVVRHRLGHTIDTTHTGGFDKNGDNDNQKARSTETYLKRYSATSILGLSTGEEKEDDGAASASISPQQYIAMRDKVELSKANQDDFLKAFGASSLEEFPTKKYNDAMSALDRKIEQGVKNGTA